MPLTPATLTIESSSTAADKVRADLLAVPVFADRRLGTGAEVVAAALDGDLSEFMEEADFNGKRGETLAVPTQGKLGAKAVILVGVGQTTKYLASGWGTMIAEVLCSGTRWNSSVSAHADAVDLEQFGELRLLLEVGAGGVAPRVPRPAVLLAEQAGERRAVLVGEAPLFADAAVPELGERLGHLDRQAVQQQVVLVLVRREQLLLAIARRARPS